MRSALLVTSFIASLLLNAGCGADSADLPSPDAAAVPHLDGASVSHEDAASDARPDASPVPSPDAVPVPDQDAGHIINLDARPVDAPPAIVVDAPTPGSQDAAAAETQGWTVDVAVEAGANPASIARSTLLRVTAELDETEKGELAKSLSGFAFALLQEVRRDPATQDNFAFSPASISLALGMAYAGAAGRTASQMKDAMRIATSTEAYFRSLNWFDQQLASRAEVALKQAQDLFSRGGSTGTAPDPADYRLHVVNAAWGERTTTFEQPYLDTLATEFGAGIHLADFKNQPEAERLAINAWVSGETLNRINDLIPPGVIDALTRAVLVNAIHLKLPWSDPFTPSTTATGTFTRSDGTTVSVPFMSQTARFSYAEDDTTQVVALPLSGGSIDFVVFLPKPTSSLAELEAALSPARVQTLVGSLGTHSVEIALPKFTFTTASIPLRTALMALGMTDAFGLDADFSGITKEVRLFISEVVHKAMVGVDENGVEAAAATAVVMAPTGIPTDVKKVDVNRPFFFGIYDRPTATWLFLGHVTDPSA